jgi:hypothetical protein
MYGYYSNTIPVTVTEGSAGLKASAYIFLSSGWMVAFTR